MGKMLVDGIEIDTTGWIDVNVTRVNNPDLPRSKRLENVRAEIAAYAGVLQNFDLPERSHDAHGKAHTKAYLATLRNVEQDLLAEIAKNRDDVLKGNSPSE